MLWTPSHAIAMILVRAIGLQILSSYWWFIIGLISVISLIYDRHSVSSVNPQIICLWKYQVFFVFSPVKVAGLKRTNGLIILHVDRKKRAVSSAVSLFKSLFGLGNCNCVFQRQRKRVTWFSAIWPAMLRFIIPALSMLWFRHR